MLKRKNKNSQQPEPPGVAGRENTRGITVGTNALQRYWLFCTVGAMLIVLLGLVYLLLVRENALQRSRILGASETYAAQQAAYIDAMLASYAERVTAAVNSPLALAAITSDTPDDLALVEKALLDYFPGLTSLRLVTIGRQGSIGLESDILGLRNHIELDLMRLAADGGITTPEAYRFEGGWLTSFAVLVQHPQQPGSRAVILATIDNGAISDALAAMAGEWGRTSLLQVYREGNYSRTDEIASGGSGAAEEFVTEAVLNDGTWQIAFTPSARLLSIHRLSAAPLLIVFGVLAAGIAMALVLFLIRLQKALKNDVADILKSTDGRTSLKLGIPELAPLARELRRVVEKQSKEPLKAAAREAARARHASTASPDAKSQAEESAPTEAPAGAELPAHIFRAYDIRGIVDEELDEHAVTLIGRALGTLAGEQGEQALIVGSDGRTSSPVIKAALVKALVNTGRDVIDIGIVPTPAVYYATHSLGTRSGVMVTASHNPSNYNGFKITLAGRPFAGEDLQRLADRARQGKFSEGAGRLAKNDIRSSYIDSLINDIAITTPLKIVVDAGNGAAGELAPQVLESLACEVTTLYCDIDGTFPNHHPDPAVDANLADLQAKVVEVGADFGVAYDGDGDRLSVVTAEGNIVRNDRLLMLFAQDIVSRNPGADVVFDIKCTRQLTQLVSKHGGKPILWKTGHAFMREKVLETGALLGGEFSGHFYFGERWYGFDDAIYATARLAEIISTSGQDLASLLAEFPSVESTPEIHIPVAEQYKFEIMRRMNEEADFSPGKVTTLDGIRVDYSDGWGLLRASNTTPALVARFEGHDLAALERIKTQFREQIKRLDAELEPGF